MRVVDRTIYADEGKLLDFKEPHYVLNEDHQVVEKHLYSTQLKMGRFDKPENYKEVDIKDIKE